MIGCGRLERQAAALASPLPSQSSVSQQAAQNPSTSSMISAHPAQRGGSAKSSTTVINRLTGETSIVAIPPCRAPLAAAQAAR